MFSDYFLLMPDPYLLARRNRLEWVAEYLDQERCQDVVTFNTKEGPLALASSPYLDPGEAATVTLRRSDKVSYTMYKCLYHLFFSQLLLLKIFQWTILQMKYWT